MNESCFVPTELHIENTAEVQLPCSATITSVKHPAPTHMKMVPIPPKERHRQPHWTARQSVPDKDWHAHSDAFKDCACVHPQGLKPWAYLGGRGAFWLEIWRSSC